jgi:hypothetical protein
MMDFRLPDKPLDRPSDMYTPQNFDKLTLWADY